MKLQPTDIITRKTDGTETLWLSQRLVMEVCGISEEYLKFIRNKYKSSVPSCYQNRETLPATGKAWRWAKINNAFYYDLAFIPNRKPAYYRSLFGDAEALRELWEKTISHNATTELELRFKRHLKANYRHFIEHYTDANEVQR
ncbi:hypothetical protein SAMN05421544_10895, partial [Riemerella columbipharyngis]